MIKYTYQTCLRMSEVLKESMTKICETYPRAVENLYPSHEAGLKISAAEI